MYVYLLRSKEETDQIYVGYTTDLEQRLARHNRGDVKSTKPYRPWEVVFYEAHINKKDAKKRERYFKTTEGRRALKLMLKDTLSKT